VSDSTRKNRATAWEAWKRACLVEGEDPEDPTDLPTRVVNAMGYWIFVEGLSGASARTYVANLVGRLRGEAEAFMRDPRVQEARSGALRLDTRDESDAAVRALDDLVAQLVAGDGPWRAGAQLSVRQLGARAAFTLMLAGTMRPGSVVSIKRPGITWGDGDRTMGFNMHDKTGSRTGTRPLKTLPCTHVREDGSLAPDAEGTLCPVCATKAYMEATRRHLAQGVNELFVHCDQAGGRHRGGVSVATLGWWIRDLLMDVESRRMARLGLFGPAPKPPTQRVLRALSATRQVEGGASLEQVMVAGHWRGARTVLQHYLRPRTQSQTARLAIRGAGRRAPGESVG
jgi:hypothetical protein